MGSTSPRRVISPVIATSQRTGMPVRVDTMAVHHGDARGRAVLGRGAFGQMDVHVVLRSKKSGDAELTWRGCAHTE
jgi:hypothetical protein